MSLKQNDLTIFEAIEKEGQRQHQTLELIASENFVSPDVLDRTWPAPRIWPQLAGCSRPSRRGSERRQGTPHSQKRNVTQATLSGIVPVGQRAPAPKAREGAAVAASVAGLAAASCWASGCAQRSQLRDPILKSIDIPHDPPPTRSRNT